MGIWKQVSKQVQIKQKTITHTPAEKLLDALIAILSGGHGLVEINTLVRPDEALQRAFGRSDCAEQSTISRTLDACTSENVAQMREVLQTVYRQQSQGYSHNYRLKAQVLDVDMSGAPAGKEGEGVTKGYFAKKRGARGRQIGRVIATRYDEIVVDCLYDGKTQLNKSLPQLIESAEKVLNLTPERRKSTLIRVDRGGGEDDHVNWLLDRDYQLLLKSFSWQRARQAGEAVTDWQIDPQEEGRAMAWVPTPHSYNAVTSQVVVRSQKKNGDYAYSILVTRAPLELIFEQAELPLPAHPMEEEQLLAIVNAYDKRGGGVETQFKGDKQGLGITKRNKGKFSAQEMLLLLAQLAHNLTIWARKLLAKCSEKLGKFGILRMVRDVFQIPGCVEFDVQGRVQSIVLNEKHPLARVFAQSFAEVLAEDDLLLILREI
jgi:hypothetical protein